MIRIFTLFSILIVSLSLAMASQIKVMTYNINLLPNIPISDMTSNLNHPYKRAYYIPKKIAKKNIDVVAFQEAIAPLSFYILDKRMKAFGYKYRTKLVGVPSLTHLNLLNGGVLIYSRYPIIGQSQYMVFPRSYGLEGISNKGVVYTAIEKKGYRYHFVSLHMQSFSNQIESSKFDAWKRQLGALQTFISNLKFSSNDRVILMGDFNTDSAKAMNGVIDPQGNIVYQTLVQDLQVFQIAPFKETLPYSYGYLSNGMTTSQEQTTLDHIMCLQGSTCADTVNSSISIISLKSKKLGSVQDLSDHYAVVADLNYTDK